MNMRIPNTFNIIPVKDKVPQVAWKEFTERIQTSEERQKFLNSGEQLGIVTGEVSKIFVLDDDGGLDAKIYHIPRTWTVKTPRGGTHYYFKWSPELDGKISTKTEVLKKVDVRGSGGYCVFYGWQNNPLTTPLALPPRWLIDLLPNKEHVNNMLVNKSDNWIMEALEAIQPGNGANGRTPTFVRVIGRLKAKGLNESEVAGLIEPWAKKYGYEERIEGLIKDQYKRYPQIINNAEQPQDSSIEAFLKDTEVVEWIVPNLIAKNSIAFVAGLPETGKTWMLIDLAIECAKGGGLWLNKYPVKQAKVLFVDQERFKAETQRRFKAVLSAKSVNSSELNQNLFIRCGTTTRLDLQNSYEAFRKTLEEIRPEIVIIDSFATFHTREENNRKDIQEVLERVKQLRNEFGCTFIFIHHENKYAFNKDGDQEPSISQMAGSVAIPAACETVLTVRKQDGGSMVYHTKSTMASTVPPFLVKVEDVDASKDKIIVRAY